MSRRGAALVGARPAIALLFAANGLVVGGFAASIPRVAERLALAPAGVAACVFTVSLGAVTVMPFVGRAIDRFGGRPVALAGAAGVPLLLPLTLEASSFWHLLAAAFPLGFALGVFDVAINAYAVAAERAAGGSWIAQVHGAWSVGSVAGSLLLVALLARGVPFPSLAVAALLAGALVVFARVAPPVAHETRRAPGAAPRAALVTLGLLAACALAVEGAMADWASLYVRRDLHASVALAPLAYAAFSGAMMAARFGGDAAIRRLGRVRTLSRSGALAAVALVAALAAPTPALATIAFALAGVGCANLAPALFGAAGRIGAGAGLATVTGIGYSAFLAGPAAIGAIAQAAGLRAALGIAVLGAAAVALGARAPAVARALALEE